MVFFGKVKKWIILILVSVSAIYLLYSYTYKIREVEDVAVYYWGSSGNTVAAIQQRLRDLGYYSDNVDGIFFLAFEQEKNIA